MRHEQQECQLVFIELGCPRKISERGRLIRGIHLPALDQVAACAPAFRNLLAVNSIRRGQWGDARQHANSGEQRSECFIPILKLIDRCRPNRGARLT